MADIKTHLRELSVATTIGLLKEGIKFNFSDLLISKNFFNYACKLISNDISSAVNILEVSSFDGELKQVVENGYRLGEKIFNHPYFSITKGTPIKWTGNDTQKDDPIDLYIGTYGFSLKEDSYILKNMGLYDLINNLTGSEYKRGLHVFSTFAPREYDYWFDYTWKSFVAYLKKFRDWSLDKENNESKAYLKDDDVILSYSSYNSIVPINIKTNREYMQLTTSLIREKVLSKWIKSYFEKDPEYIKLKKGCAEVAGNLICKIYPRS